VDKKRIGTFDGSWKDFLVYESKVFPKCTEVISLMEKGIRRGDNFPLLDVVLHEDKYHLFCQGNHRAISHYFKDAPINYRLFYPEDGLMFFNPKEYFPIEESLLRSFDSEDADDVNRLIEAFSYFNEEEVWDFCERNELVFPGTNLIKRRCGEFGVDLGEFLLQ
jgi:hypothetical protein